MEKVVIINNCYSCPNFDDIYYTYNHECGELNRVLTREEALEIPKDCPLKTVEEFKNA